MDNEKNNKSKIVINVLIILCTIVIVVLAVQLVKIALSYAESRKEYDALRKYTFLEDIQEDLTEEDMQSMEQTGPSQAEEDESEETDASEEEKKNVIKKEPTCSISVDFASLQKINPDIKGWLYLEALNISYPIVQGEDNDEYLYTTVQGTSNNSGSIFMESLNAGDFSDPHTLIYGHNMKDGSMFGHLKNLYDQDYVDNLESVLCFWIITPNGKSRYDIFSIHTVSASGEAYTIFSGECDEVGTYLNSMARLSGVELPQRVYNSKDKAVTLSTCTGSDEYRLIVQGVLHVD